MLDFNEQFCHKLEKELGFYLKLHCCKFVSRKSNQQYLELEEIHTTQINEIQTEKDHEYLQKLLESWITTENVTWNKLFKALRNIGKTF